MIQFFFFVSIILLFNLFSFFIFSTNSLFSKKQTSTCFQQTQSQQQQLAFENSSINGEIYAIQIFENQLYIGGSFTEIDGISMSYISKWNGSNWNSIQNGTNSYVNCFAIFQSQLYVGGHFTSVGNGLSANTLAKWNGLNWSVLDTELSVFSFISSMKVIGNLLYIGGLFSIGTSHNIGTWNGSGWGTLKLGTNAEVHSITNNGADSNVFVGGSFTMVDDGIEANYIAKWDGSSWNNLGSGLDDSVYTMTFFNNELFVGGDFTETGDNALETFYIACWDETNWESVGGVGFDDSVYSLQVVGNDLYVAGDFSQIASLPITNHIAKWNGSTWSSLSGLSAHNDTIFALFYDDVEGSLFIGGTEQFSKLDICITSTPPQPTPQPTTSQPTPTTPTTTTTTAPCELTFSNYGDGPSATVYAIQFMRNELYIGGSFVEVGGVQMNYTARWNGTSWIPLGRYNYQGTNNAVYALAVFQNHLYVGGAFTIAGGLSASKIARWNGTYWFVVGTGTEISNTPGHYVWTMEIASASTLYIGGMFIVLGSTNVAKWDGVSYSTLSTGADGIVRSLESRGNDLYIGGAFTIVGGIYATRIAKWNGTWYFLGTGMNMPVYALAFFGDDLYAGGSFTTAGGLNASRLAKWNGNDWSAISPEFQSSGTISELLASTTNLYVGGLFSSIGGSNATRIARFDGQNWFSLGEGINSTVLSIVEFNDYLYVGSIGTNDFDRVLKFGCFVDSPQPTPDRFNSNEPTNTLDQLTVKEL